MDCKIFSNTFREQERKREKQREREKERERERVLRLLSAISLKNINLSSNDQCL